MGDSFGSKVFDVSREVTNWTIPEDDGSLPNDIDGYWTPSNGSFNASLVGNTTSTSNYQRNEDLAKLEMAILALIFILTILGNCVVLLGIFFRRQKMTRMYYFILHLTFADLITAFFNVLTQLIWEITYRFQGGNFLCKFVKYTQILGPYSSSYVLVMTALDRYQAICYPLSNCTWTAKRSNIMLALAWTLSLLFCLPQIFIFSYQVVKPATDTEPAEFDCWGKFPDYWGAKAYVTWYSITVFVIPLIILVFAYTCITRAIWINFNMKAAGRNHDNYERRMTRQDSDDGEPSQYDHSVDESVYHREQRLSIRANASHTIASTGANKKSLNINLYNPTKHFLTTRNSTTSTTSAGGDLGSDGGRMSVNNTMNRTSTSSCTTQSSTLSPNLSSRRMPALEDKGDETEGNKSSLCFTSQKLFVSNGSNGGHTVPQELHDDEEQLQLIPKESQRNELCHIVPTTRVCHSSSPSPDKDDLDENHRAGLGTQLKNGSVKLHETNDTCHHGCYGKRCNFCHLSPTNSDRSSVSVGNNIGGESGNTHANQLGPYPTGKERDKENNQSYRFSGSSLLPTKIRFSRKGSRGGNGRSINGGNNHHLSTKSSMATYVDHQQPRTHSVKGISRAKIKTIKLTVTIICCYIFCSSPFIAAQLWMVYDPLASSSPFFTGVTFTILTLLASLNSCVNPYIFLFFNPNLLENCYRGIFRPKFPARRFNNGSPLARTMSQGKKAQFGVAENTPTVRKLSGGGIPVRKGPTPPRTIPQPSGVTKRGGSAPKPFTHPQLNHSSPLLNREEKERCHKSPYQVPGSNGFEKEYLERLSERNESALELVDSTAPATVSITNGTIKEKYSPVTVHGAQCRVETVLGGRNHVSTSTLIT